MSPDERDIIVQQCLSTEDNIRVALLVGMAFDDLRCRIISGFAECLSGRLHAAFSRSWRVTNGIGVDGFLQKGGSLWAVRHVGIERVCVRLMYDRSPERMYYSLLDEESPSPATINWDLVKQELDRRLAVGQTSETSRWMSLVDQRYRNWYDPETLLKLWKKDEAVTYFMNQLGTIMGIVANVLQMK
jgi:hypothetical protein